jgi:hypothetical protein
LESLKMFRRIWKLFAQTISMLHWIRLMMPRSPSFGGCSKCREISVLKP